MRLIGAAVTGAAVAALIFAAVLYVADLEIAEQDSREAGARNVLDPFAPWQGVPEASSEEVVPVPAVIDLSLPDARRELELWGLLAVLESHQRFGRPPVVVAQSPRAGSEAQAGAVVELTLGEIH